MEQADLEVPPRKLKSLHEIMTDTKLESGDWGRTEPDTYRVHRVIKLKAKEICKGNNTSLSAFLRQVVTQLVEDYS